MSDSEEESYCFYGTALDPYDEDTFPKKRPITVEEQIATDDHGRRRFHGAFTGGFSAGFFNTVGSLEGWTPSEFKSSRDDKADKKTRNPEDYMDEEDLGEFGIAPQTVKATSDYSNVKKRKKQVWSDGPIPGEPVLETLINSGNETIGYMLLKNMDLKNRILHEPSTEGGIVEKKVYGCEMPKVYEINRSEVPSDDHLPEIYKEFLRNPKTNTFGLGYVGLNRSHINLFQSTNLVVKERNNKKFSITGQAFGVGAFEDEDEDIYVKDNMEKYDFELTGEKAKNKTNSKAEDDTKLEIFVLSKQKLVCNTVYPPPVIPHSFTGKHKVRRSRFEPLPQETVQVKRKDMNAGIRAKYLGEDSTSENTSVSDVDDNKIKTENSSKSNIASEASNKRSLLFSKESLLHDRFVSASQPEDPSNILEEVKRTETLHGTEEMRGAAKMKMFGPLTRVNLDWIPCAILCRRFNVPETHLSDASSQKKKRTKNLIFEYQKHDEEIVLKPGLTVHSNENSVAKAELTQLGITDNMPVEENSKTDVSIENVSNKVISLEENVTPEQSSSTNITVTQLTSAVNKDITEKINVSEKVDLFKAIFLSDSESEEEEEETEKKNDHDDRNETIKANILTDQLVLKIVPKKDGILSNLDLSQLTRKPENDNKKIVETTITKTSEESTEKGDCSILGPNVVEDPTFGPKLPDKISKTAVFMAQASAVDDEWIEKDEIASKAHKHKHKTKKDKHKSKKDKHDHKKKHKHHKRS